MNKFRPSPLWQGMDFDWHRERRRLQEFPFKWFWMRYTQCWCALISGVIGVLSFGFLRPGFDAIASENFLRYAVYMRKELDGQHDSQD